MDEKLCPMRKGWREGVEGGSDETFAPCLREKCAWWRTGIVPKGSAVIVDECAIVTTSRRPA